MAQMSTKSDALRIEAETASFRWFHGQLYSLPVNIQRNSHHPVLDGKNQHFLLSSARFCCGDVHLLNMRLDNRYNSASSEEAVEQSQSRTLGSRRWSCKRKNSSKPSYAVRALTES